MGSLVGAVKTYAYMDRGSVVEADLHEGLDSTLSSSGTSSSTRRSRSCATTTAALPKLMVRGSELNQVWTNIIHNAIDALGDHGTITISTRLDGDCAQVDIADDGPGIPAGRPAARPRALLHDRRRSAAGRAWGSTPAGGSSRRATAAASGSTRPGAGTTFHVRLPVRR
jgi:signal transduction histidine kinase